MTSRGSLLNIDALGGDWLHDGIDELTDYIEHCTPVEFNSAHRYLSRAETPMSGLLDLSITPYWIKPLNSLDPYSPVREINIKKGVKTSYNTTFIESGILYLAAHLRAFPGAFVTANKEMAQKRLDSHIVTMFQNSGFGDIFSSSDSDSAKTGKTRQKLQWLGGGSLDIEGGKNADTMRMYGWMYLFLDEIDSFPLMVGKDGDPIGLLKDRCAGFWEMRKIGTGSTPLLKGSSHIDKQFLRGDQQQYECRCLKCGYPMRLRWFNQDLNKPDVKRGLIWEYKDGMFDAPSIRYECWNCGHGHEELDKEKFIASENADWKATATPVEKGIESYHMPALLSRLRPWSKAVADWHEAFEPSGKVKSIEKMQWFYNNVLGKSFEQINPKIKFSTASGHRRNFYRQGQIPNEEIKKYCKSGVMFVGMTVDVQLHFLSVATWGFTIGGNVWLIEYKTLKDDSEEGCLNPDSAAWNEVQYMIDEQEYISDDFKSYRIAMTLVDCGWGESDSVVSEFCAQWTDSVYPSKGDSYSYKRIKSFFDYKTSGKNTAYMIAVDHYKSRLSSVLRRKWQQDDGDQERYHFNAPEDLPDDSIKELTREYKKQERKKDGNIKTVWHRPPGTRNELWDLLVYANALLDIMAFQTCTGNLELEDVDYPRFWEHCEEESFFTQEEDGYVPPEE